MDFKIADGLADEYAERIRSGEGGEIFDKLVRMCIPYLVYLKTRLGFCGISDNDVRDELAADTVSDAIMKEDSKHPFSYRLHNTFRDLCRQRERALKDGNRKHIERLIKKYETRGTPIASLNPQPATTESNIQQREEKLLVLKALQGHPEFSKKVVFQRFRGSSYSEISQIYTKSFNECKRVFEHDYYHIKKKFSRIQNKEEK